MNKQYILWQEVREWCRTHPTKRGMIATHEGTFSITFIPTPAQLKGNAESLFVDFKPRHKRKRTTR